MMRYKNRKEVMCGDCIYWFDIGESQDDQTRLGECRRYPPIRFNNDRWEFPDTHEFMWCGEFKK